MANIDRWIIMKKRYLLAGMGISSVAFAVMLLLLGAAPPAPIQRNIFTTNVQGAQLIGDIRSSANASFDGTITNGALTASRPVITDANKKLSSATGTPDGTKFLRDDGTLAVPPGLGTMTSVALGVSPLFGTNGTGTVTTSGTLSFTNVFQSANTVLAGPTSGGKADPTFRALVTADLPSGIVITAGETNTTLTASRAVVTDANQKLATATGTPDGTKFLRDDNTYATPSGGSVEAGYFGDGSDGNVVFDGTSTVIGLVPTNNTYWLNRDIFMSSGVLSNGAGIYPFGYMIFCSGTFTNAGSITNSGPSGGAGAAATTAGVVNTAPSAGSTGGGGSGTPGGAGANGAGAQGGLSAGNRFAGGTGGGSGAGGSAAGGAGGTVGSFTLSQSIPPRRLLTQFSFGASGIMVGGRGGVGGGGGAGTGAAPGAGGGGGGAGGGVTVLFCAGISNSGTIACNGGNGGSGGNASNVGAAGGGGGGGGGGGLIYLAYKTLNNSGTLGVTAGSLGTGGTGNGAGNPGTNGFAGGTGTVIKYNFTTHAFE